ncbi:arginine deiminase-related protein [Desertihabitans brevis]|nr:arginine deiminase-related protein [Desertihabitans brevis]
MTLLAEPTLGPSGDPTSVRAPGAVVMIRPHHFRPNPQTAADNAFQLPVPGHPELAARAFAEVTAVAGRLTAAGVRVHLFDDPDTRRPDSVFCNNWITTHADGRVVLHSMHAPNRRREPRADVVDALRAAYRVTEVIDLTAGPPLEGTGAMVLDPDRRTAYVSRSLRADDTALATFCARLGYRAHAFDTADRTGRAVYHTNVMLCLATGLSLVGLDLVPDPRQRRRLAEALAQRGEVVALSTAQVAEFAGNALELTGTAGRLLAMSSRGWRSLTSRQRRAVERHLPVLALDVPTLELAGGSVRCMLAGVHLPAR